MCVNVVLWFVCIKGQVTAGVQCPPPVVSAAEGMTGKEHGCGKKIWDVRAHQRPPCPLCAIPGSAGAGCGHKIHRMCWFVGSQLAHRQLKMSLADVF